MNKVFFEKYHPDAVQYLDELRLDYNFSISIDREIFFDLVNELEQLGLSNIEIKLGLEKVEQICSKLIEYSYSVKIYYAKKQYFYEFIKHSLNNYGEKILRNQYFLSDNIENRKLMKSFVSKMQYFDRCFFLSATNNINSLMEEYHRELFGIDAALQKATYKSVLTKLPRIIGDDTEINKYSYIFKNISDNIRAKWLEDYCYEPQKVRNKGINVFQVGEKEFLIVQRVILDKRIAFIPMDKAFKLDIAIAQGDKNEVEYLGANSFLNDEEFRRDAKLWGTQEWLEYMFKSIKDRNIQKIITKSKFHCVAICYDAWLSKTEEYVYPKFKQKNMENYFNIRVKDLYENGN